MSLEDSAEDNYNKIMTGDVKSCSEESEKRGFEEYDLPCNICEEEGECLFYLFTIEDSDNPREILEDTPSNTIQKYIEHLNWKNGFYLTYSTKDKQGRSMKQVIEKKISLLETILKERKNKGL
ncbi:hypothetical protein KY332_01615 [Candidatus Woesearchaeota archaeon]|nr:hypothetical protein [Candidatus Woesearchaeota archaeon]